jgi:hypothetical protein
MPRSTVEQQWARRSAAPRGFAAALPGRICGPLWPHLPDAGERRRADLVAPYIQSKWITFMEHIIFTWKRYKLHKYLQT